MPRYKLTLEYDGTPFVGWQVQDGQMSVQGRLAQAIADFSGEAVIPRGAGRTDAGVHARGQVAALSAGDGNYVMPSHEVCVFARDQIEQTPHSAGDKDWSAVMRLAERLDPGFRE